MPQQESNDNHDDFQNDVFKKTEHHPKYEQVLPALREYRVDISHVRKKRDTIDDKPSHDNPW